MDITSVLTKYVESTNYEDLSANTINATKKTILDTIGVTIAGTRSKDIKILVDMTKDYAGKAESTIFGYGGKVPSYEAALINSFSATVLDYDDFHDMDCCNISRSLIPAIYAISEHKGKVSGKEFITAVALGYDLASRISRASPIHRESGFMNAPAALGAAFGAGKILGFDAQKLQNAVGLAFMQVTVGIGAGSLSGLNIKGMGFGFLARAGAYAALLAEKGYESEKNPIAWYYAECQRNKCVNELLTVDLGKVLQIETNSQKPYPCCRFNHTAIKAALDIVINNDLKPEDVNQVMIYYGPVAIGLCQPLEQKRKPQNSLQAQFSTPWLVANAILNRDVKVEHFTEENVHSHQILEMTNKISVKMRPDLHHLPMAEPTVVEITDNKGNVYSQRVEFAPGSPEDPMSIEDIAEKFEECCLYSHNPISQENRDAVIQMIKDLEKVADIRDIAALLS